MKFTNRLKVIFSSVSILFGTIAIGYGQLLQLGYTKVLHHTTTTHTQGKSLLDHNGIRFGGFSNAKPDIPFSEQIFHVRDYYKFWSSNGSNNESYVIIEEIFQGSVSIECNAIATNFPYPSSTDSYYGSLPCSLLLNPPYNGFLTTNIIHEHSSGPDYNLTILDANIDLQVNSSKVIGTTWLENNGFCDNCPDQCLSPSRATGYFLGSTRMPILGGASKMAVNLLDNNHSVLWAKEVGLLNSPNEKLQETMLFGTNNGGVIVNFKTGWLPGGVIQLDNTGFPLWGQKYQLMKNLPNARKISAYVSDFYQNPNAPLSPILLTSYAIRASGNAIDIPMAVIEISPQTGTIQATAMFSNSDYRIFPIRIKKTIDNNYIIVGQIIQTNTTDLSDIFVMKLDPTYSLLWAKSYHLGEYSIANDIAITSGGDFWISGVTNIEHPGFPNNNDYHLMHLDPNGSVIQGRYYKTFDSEQAVALLTPVTGEHIIDGYYRNGSTGNSGVSFSRLFTKADLDGIALYCNSIPFDITGTNLSLVSGGSAFTSSIPANLISSVTLNPTSNNVIVLEQPSGCEDCHCE